jgi:hypothetical protein
MVARQILYDDLDNSEGASTIRFAVEGQAFETDLSDANAERLARALEPFVRVARPVGKKAVDNGESALIREWAARNGIDVNQGRIPAEIVEQYKEAQAANV